MGLFSGIKNMFKGNEEERKRQEEERKRREEEKKREEERQKFIESLMRMFANEKLSEVQHFIDVGKENGTNILEAIDQQGTTALMAATMNPDVEVLRLIANSLSGNERIIKATDKSGKTAMHNAALFSKNPDYVRILADIGVPVNSKEHELGITPLIWAVDKPEHDNSDLILALIDAVKKSGEDINASSTKEKWTALHRAAKANPDPEVIRALVNAGANTEARDSYGFTAIMNAFDNPNPEIIKTLAELGADVNASANINSVVDPMPALFVTMISSGRSTLEHLKALIEAGTDMNARTSNGDTALIGAVTMTCPPEIVKLIAEHTQDINAEDAQGLNAYALSFAIDNAEFVQAMNLESKVNIANNKANMAILESMGAKVSFVSLCRGASSERVKNAIAQGANVNEKDAKGMTCLMYAMLENADPDVFLALIDSGANINARNNEGASVLDLALEIQNYAAANYLQALGAR